MYNSIMDPYTKKLVEITSKTGKDIIDKYNSNINIDGALLSDKQESDKQESDKQESDKQESDKQESDKQEIKSSLPKKKKKNLKRW